MLQRAAMSGLARRYSVGRVFALIASSGILVLSLIYLLQRSILFPIPVEQLPVSLPENVEKIELDEGYALFVRAQNIKSERSPLIIYAHGNADLAYWSIEPLSHFTQNGIHVLILEYPGYAGSRGSPSRSSIEKSALAAFDRVATRPDVDRDKIAVYGRSVGGGAACILAAQRKVTALILESTFSSLADLVAAKGFPSFVLRDHFENEAIVSELQLPILIYHGTRDTVIPYENGDKLYGVARNGSFISEECGHNDCPLPWRDLDKFLQAAWNSRAPSGDLTSSSSRNPERG